MNRVPSSSSNAQTKKLPQSQSQSQPQPAAKKEKNLKRERFPANPLRGLSTRSSGSSSCSSNASGSGSGSISGIASNGCHRFLLSHSLSSSSSNSSSLGVFPYRPVKSVTKTPKSAPVVSKPLIRKKPRILEETKLKSTLTEKPISQKPQRFKSNPKPVLKKQAKLKDEQTSIRVDDSIAQITTPVSKLGNESDLIYRSNNCEAARVDDEKTPPVQASVSPEILQHGSSLSVSAQSQACYAAGHLLSGVSDKRKCKPKGILTVGKGKILNDSDEFDEGDFSNSVSMMPSDASVQWLLSPCEEEKELEKEIFDRSRSSDLCNISSGKSLRMSSSLSPNELSRFRRLIDLSSLLTPTCKLDSCKEDIKGEKSSPLSVDTLGSENVIQTPESNSSFDNYLGFFSSQDVGSDLESLTTNLQSARLSPQEVPNSSSFKFDSLATSSDSIDLSRFQRDHKGKERELLQCSGAESISTDGGGLVCSEDSNWMACYNN